MAMRIGTEMPPLGGATEWFGSTQAGAEEIGAGQSDSGAFLVRQLWDLQGELAALSKLA